MRHLLNLQLNIDHVSFHSSFCNLDSVILVKSGVL